jgi:hypothetical protein
VRPDPDLLHEGRALDQGSIIPEVNLEEADQWIVERLKRRLTERDADV